MMYCNVSVVKHLVILVRLMTHRKDEIIAQYICTLDQFIASELGRDAQICCFAGHALEVRTLIKNWCA